jgi:hypothetical protein
MDPVSLILTLALKNPHSTAEALKQYNEPGQVDVQQLSSSLADFAMQALNCYHKSARFRGVSVLGAPWLQQTVYGASGSVVIRINFTGFSGAQYQMLVAAMAKQQAYRTFVIHENSLVPYNRHCSLENWKEV